MKAYKWWGLVALVIAGDAGAEDLTSGIWMLDIYNPRAPLRTIQLTIEADDNSFSAAEMGDGRRQIDNFRFVDNELWFHHLNLDEACMLRFDQSAGKWQGTCPPNNEPKFDGGLTVSLREPRGGNTTTEDSTEGQVSADEAEDDSESVLTTVDAETDQDEGDGG